MKESLKEKKVELRKKTESSKKGWNIGKILKIIIFIFCFSGFGYQVMEFFCHFLTYPTVINVEVKIPDSFVLPALTFCNINPVQRTKYCEKYPSHCMKPKDIQSFCAEFPKYCTRNSSNLKIPKRKYQSDSKKQENRLTENDIIELGQNPENFDVTEIVAGEDGINAGNFTRVYFTNANKDVFLCHTINARYTNATDLPPKKFESADDGFSTTFGFFLLNVQPEEYFRMNEKHGVRFLIHSPYYAINPYIKGLFMSPGAAYKIHVRMEEDNLLPYPYKTDCLDYDDLWMKNGNTPSRSQQMCKNNCQRIFNAECYGCERDLTIYFANDKICNLRDNISCVGSKPEDILKENLKSCLDLCKKDCRKWRYPYSIEVIPETMLEEKSLILVSISMDDQEVVVLTHKPQYEKIELFSYIGGFMGCWMGLSIWAFTTNIGQTIRPMKAGIATFHRRLLNRRI